MEQLDRLRQALADRYRIEREIGHGGMATVYLAEDLKHDRHVAVKVLRPDLASMLGADRFLREIRIEAGLQHINILPVHDSGESDGFLYYVMPYVEGETLRQRIDRERQLPVDEAVRITREIAEALTYAHARGIVHRDIKPENVLLSEGHAMLADFGIARAMDVAGGTRLTETGHTVGTPLYMSPEQASGDIELDGRSDVYSLACVLYEMLAGEPPYSGRTAQAILARHMLEDPPELKIVRPSAPPSISQAIEKALAKTPADRFPTADSFATALATPVESRVRETPEEAYGERTVSKGLWLLRQLRARFVLHVLLVYVAFAWLTTDFALELADRGALATWVVPALLLGLAAGLPVAVAVSWTRKPAEQPSVKSRRRRIWPSWVESARAGHLLSLLALLALSILVARRYLARPAPPSEPISQAAPFEPTRIAVRPFVDASPDQQLGHLALVFPEYLTDQLSGLEAFDVVPYAATRRYPPDAALESMASDLRAGTIVEGTVMGSENETRVSVSLTDANSLSLLYSEVYPQPRGETLALLDTLTADVARALRRELGVVVRDLERKAGTNNDAAWEHFAHGREWATLAYDLWRSGGSEQALHTYERADSAFTRAHSIDPDWVDPIVERGWVSYHQARIRKPNLMTRDPELLRQGIELAARALELDSLNARALDLRGTLRYWLAAASSAEEARRLRQDAERDLRVATAIDPSNAHAWHRLARVFTAQGRHADAKRAAERALLADQYYEEREEIFTQLCFGSLNNRQWADVTRWCEAGLNEFPNSELILNVELLALASPGGPEPNVDKAWQLRDRFLEANPPEDRAGLRPSATFYVAAVLARAGLADSARAIVRQARGTGSDPMHDYNEAHVRLLLGDTAQALRLLERYLDARPAEKESLRTDWWFEPLHADARFQELVFP